jgi:hypothetical protein
MTESSPRQNQFTDSLDRKWNLVIDYDSIIRLRGGSLALDLLDVTSENSSLLTRLATDDILLVATIYTLLEPAIKERGLTDKQFVAGLTGNGLENALDALIEGIANFSRPQRGAMLRKVWSKLKSSESSLSRQASEMLDNPEIDQKMSAALANRLDQALAKLNN